MQNYGAVFVYTCTGMWTGEEHCAVTLSTTGESVHTISTSVVEQVEEGFDFQDCKCKLKLVLYYWIHTYFAESMTL